ncbi:hypothetical protein [Devosia sp. 2618]|uniref:hypothetical protein n=1 Tax=Devosia sp. 2618 TaxID=3156454 RepID=UPI0033993022
MSEQDPAKIVPLVPRASDVQAMVNRLAQDSKNVSWRAQTHETHAEGRMELRDITDRMMFDVLRLGYVKGQIELGKNPGEIKVKMCKKMKGLRDVGVVTIVMNSERLFIKTVEWEDPK